MTKLVLAAMLTLGALAPSADTEPPSESVAIFRPRPPAEPVRSAGWCQQARITGYVRTHFSPRTYDGSSIYSDEPIAAASWNIPLGWHVWVDEIGTFRVADRGMLGSSGWVDIAVWSVAEAQALTSWRTICVYPVS